VTSSRFTEPYAEQLRQCVELFAAAEERNEPFTPRREADPVLFQIAARTTKTFRAVLHLCILGHGEQGCMLVRSLFEDTLTAHWIDQNPEEAVERLGEHRRHSSFLWKEHLVERGLDLGALADLPDLTDEERNSMAEQFGSRGERPWTGKSPYRLIKAIEANWVRSRSALCSGTCMTSTFAMPT
jgi:hypothetical protein